MVKQKEKQQKSQVQSKSTIILLYVLAAIGVVAILGYFWYSLTHGFPGFEYDKSEYFNIPW